MTKNNDAPPLPHPSFRLTEETKAKIEAHVEYYRPLEGAPKKKIPPELQEAEKAYFRRMLDENKGNIKVAAAKIGLSQLRFKKKLAAYGMLTEQLRRRHQKSTYKPGLRRPNKRSCMTPVGLKYFYRWQVTSISKRKLKKWQTIWLEGEGWKWEDLVVEAYHRYIAVRRMVEAGREWKVLLWDYTSIYGKFVVEHHAGHAKPEVRFQISKITDKRKMREAFYKRMGKIVGETL